MVDNMISNITKKIIKDVSYDLVSKLAYGLKGAGEGLFIGGLLNLTPYAIPTTIRLNKSSSRGGDYYVENEFDNIEFGSVVLFGSLTTILGLIGQMAFYLGSFVTFMTPNDVSSSFESYDKLFFLPPTTNFISYVYERARNVYLDAKNSCIEDKVYNTDIGKPKKIHELIEGPGDINKAIAECWRRPEK